MNVKMMTRRKPRSPLVIAPTALVVMLVLAGCRGGPDGRDLPDSLVPPDLAIRMTVIGSDEAASIEGTSAQFILDADRHLRVALGSGATRRYFPNTTRIITFAEQQQLAEHLHGGGLKPGSDDPGRAVDTVAADGGAKAAPGDAPAVRYDVTLIANGERYRFQTTPAQSPPTLQLHRMLIAAMRAKSLAKAPK